jgi:glucose/arabinose dehydrogenase
LIARAAALAASVVLAACGSTNASNNSSGASTTDKAQSAGLKVRTIATGLQVPWGIAFLPDGNALVAERTTGKIVRIPAKGGTPKTVMTVPGVDTGAGEGGLLGLAVSPDYKTDKLVYAYFTTKNDNRIVRFKLGGTLQPILTGLDRALNHDGGRIAFGPDGKLYAGVGDATERDPAQSTSSRNGKILRINPDGSVPSDNPFPNSPIWTLGHRNPQGLAWDKNGRMWSSEFGQDTWDEVNLIRKGHNYGWPVVEGKASTQGGKFTNPLVQWHTSDASPSGDAVKGNYLYVAALRGASLYRMKISGTKLGKPKRFLQDRFGRLRTVVVAPDGSLWVSTSNRDGRGSPSSGDDRIIRVTGI